MSVTLEEMKKDKRNIEITIERMLRDFQKKYQVNISGITVYNDLVDYLGEDVSYITEVHLNIVV